MVEDVIVYKVNITKYKSTIYDISLMINDYYTGINCDLIGQVNI